MVSRYRETMMFGVEYWIAVAVFAVLAFLSGAMALKRGRDGAIWFVIGFFTGPLALLALLLFPLPPKARL